MKHLARLMLVPAITLAAFACKGHDTKVDDALNNDLSLASQAHPVTVQDSISAAERAAAASGTPVPRTTVRRSTSTSSSSGTRSTSSTTRSNQPIDHVEKNTGRDAAIGAGAGAILGAVTSKDKVKGGLIGAAAGGILGAVIGNNVDKKKVPNK